LLFLVEKLVLLSYNVIMNTFFGKINSKLNGLADKLQDFVYGNVFPICVAIAVFAFWITNLSLVGFGILLCCLALVFILFKDLTPALPFVFMIPMPFRDMSVFGSALPYIFIGVAVLALIINFIRFPWKKFKPDRLFYAHLGLSAVMLLGGLFSQYLGLYLSGIGTIGVVGIGMFAVYILITNRIAPPKNCDVKIKFSLSLIIAVCLACLQLLYAVSATYFFDYMSFGDIYDIIPEVERNPTFCWANLCHFSYLIMLTVPFCCYMMLRSNKLYPWFILLAFFYVSMVATTGDIPLGLSVLALIPLATAVYKNLKAQHAKIFNTLFKLALLALAFVLTLLLVTGLLQVIVDKFLVSFSNDNGRTRLYIKAWGLFLESPVFGVGHGQSAFAIMNSNLKYAGGFFHSTILHTLASYGIVGVLAFAFLYYARFKALAKNGTIFGYFALIAVLQFVVYAMVDNGEYHFTTLFVTVIVAFTNLVNNKGNDDLPLPLMRNPLNSVINR